MTSPHRAKEKTTATLPGNALRTSGPLLLAQFTALLLNQFLKLIQQFAVVFRHRLDQIRKRQRGRRSCSKQAADGFSGGRPLQVFARDQSGIAEGASLSLAAEHLLFVEAVKRGHHRGVSDLEAAIIDQFAHRGRAALPDFLQKALFKRSKLRQCGWSGTKEFGHETPRKIACLLSYRVRQERRGIWGRNRDRRPARTPFWRAFQRHP